MFNRRRDYLLDDRRVENANYRPSENVLRRRGIRERDDKFDFPESRNRKPDMDWPDLETFEEEKHYSRKESRQTPIQDPFACSACCCEGHSRDK